MEFKVDSFTLARVSSGSSHLLEAAIERAVAKGRGSFESLKLHIHSISKQHLYIKRLIDTRSAKGRDVSRLTTNRVSTQCIT